jgi:hypothetical protein
MEVFNLRSCSCLWVLLTRPRTPVERISGMRELFPELEGTVITCQQQLNQFAGLNAVLGCCVLSAHG